MAAWTHVGSGDPVLLVSCCLRCVEELSDANLDILAGIGAAVSSCMSWFAIGGDFNMEPSALGVASACGLWRPNWHARTLGPVCLQLGPGFWITSWCRVGLPRGSVLLMRVGTPMSLRTTLWS
eukprot:5797810-Pyramimonas_sp.AAC.1